MTKTCARCKVAKDTSAFGKNIYTGDGFRYDCKDCTRNEARARRAALRAALPGAPDPVSPPLPSPDAPADLAAVEKAAVDAARKLEAATKRRASDYEALKPEDYDVGVGNVGTVDPSAGAEKRQEFTREQGEFLDLLKDSNGDPARMPAPEAAKSAHYLALVAEQERRFQNRRLARSATIWQANEALNLRMLMQVAKDYFYDKIQPSGYAIRTPIADFDRVDVLVSSDLHFGAERSERDNPKRYGVNEESRRWARVVDEFCHYKSKHRNRSRALWLITGDVFEGRLHDQNDGLPIEEQHAAALHYLARAAQMISAAYPAVEVWWQPGNHGRDPGRHPGRQTSRKHEGPEWELGYVLAQVCAGLSNMKWHVPFKAVGVVPLFNHWILQTHGDTEIPLGDPDTKARENSSRLAEINALRTYGVEFAAGVFGHFHKARYFPWEGMRAIFNGALIPGRSQGYARAAGMVRERCAQVIWEATAAHPVGHFWPLELGDAEDDNADLNKLIPGFRFGSESPIP